MEKPARFAAPSSRPLDAAHRPGCAASHSLEVAPRPQRASSAMPRRRSRLYRGEEPCEHTAPRGVIRPSTCPFAGLGNITTSTGDYRMTSISENCSLFEIDTELDTLLEQIEEQVETEGEPSEELLSRFREFCVAHGEKVDRIGRFVRMMEAREQYCRAEAARLGERARSTAPKVDRTKSMVLFYLMSRELRKIEGREFTLRIQKNSHDSVRILDDAKLPMAYR